ncbi:MAG: DUF3048 domain-containing protein [Ruminococcaceae bacterium]|nr:DUF3048 domain-containing protein [Oscillospiraceae bacterium]
MYKRVSCLLAGVLAAVMLLSACGSDAPPTASSSSGDGSLSLEPSVSTMAPVDPIPLYTNPLTGEGTDVDLSANRPVAIMLNNLKKALPQCGISQADIIYEAPAEGGITRMMAVFQSLDGVGTLGSVRSARPYYVELAAGLDAIFIHAGGSDDAYSAIKKHGVFNIDGVNGPYGGTMFYRDAQRKKTAGFEHSLFTDEARIQKLLSGSLSKMRQTHNEGYSLPLTFAEDAAPANGQSANSISVKYSYYKTGLFTYDTQSETYLVGQLVDKQNGPYVDGNNDQQVAVTNVLVLCTDVNPIKGDTAGRLTVRLAGTGSGYFACGGQYIPITWSKESPTAPFRFSTADGQPLTLGAGKSYINIVDTGATVTFE